MVYQTQTTAGQYDGIIQGKQEISSRGIQTKVEVFRNICVEMSEFGGHQTAKRQRLPLEI
jgi:hypothetical protein